MGGNFGRTNCFRVSFDDGVSKREEKTDGPRESLIEEGNLLFGSISHLLMSVCLAVNGEITWFMHLFAEGADDERRERHEERC